MLKSTHSPQFADKSNSAINAAYVAAFVERKALIAQADNGDNVDTALDAIDLMLFCLDDELCARGLDLPV